LGRSEFFESAATSRADVLRESLTQLYGRQAVHMVARLLEMAPGNGIERPHRAWSEKDAWLITYPDQFQETGTPPLQTLSRFYRNHLATVLNGVHILPCYPWTSDDGYAVSDHLAIDARYGRWTDVEDLAGVSRVMLDAVINHMSASAGWFKAFLDDAAGFEGFFRTADPSADLSATVRPRATPLLTSFEGADGERWVWTTFSADQVDLDYRTPEVFIQVAGVLFEYARRGAQMIRLDAVQFLGKEEGTTSINLPTAHLIVQALRQSLDLAFPDVLLVAESNVPHRENLAYLGGADQREAQMVYQFALAPMVLHTMLTGDATAFKQWASDLQIASTDTTVLNYLASHDGVAVRPVEGILSAQEVDDLVALTERAGGHVNVRAVPGGVTAPYELASTWFDLMAVGHDEPQAIARHLASHSVMLALQGVPAIYIHSLFGSSNDHELAAATGMARSLNRRKFIDVPGLELELATPNSRTARCFAALAEMLELRSRHGSFDPSVPHTILDTAPGVIGIQRGERDRVFVNISSERQTVLTPMTAGEHSSLELEPWESRWLVGPTSA